MGARRKEVAGACSSPGHRRRTSSLKRPMVRVTGRLCDRSDEAPWLGARQEPSCSGLERRQVGKWRRLDVHLAHATAVGPVGAVRLTVLAGSKQDLYQL